MLEDISKLFEFFYLVFIFIYNQGNIINYDLFDSDSDSDSDTSIDETLSDISENMSLSSQEDVFAVEYSGYQQNYHTRILKTMKSVCTYDSNMAVLLCHMLTTETDHHKQLLLRQLLTGVESSIVEEEIMVHLQDDIDVRIHISKEEKDKTKKNTFIREIYMSVESFLYRKDEIDNCLHNIRKPYVKVNGNVKSKFINEMYIHYFDEPCLLENSQIMKIKKTVNDVLDSYHVSTNQPDRFLTSLLL